MTEIISVQNEAPPTWEPEVEQAGPSQISVWMTGFTSYDAATGRIKYRGNCTNVELEIHRTLGPVVEGEYDGEKYYVNNGEIFDRPVMALHTEGDAVADATTEVRLYGVPDGALLKCSGAENFSVEVHYEAEQFITLVFASPGEHVFNVERFPYIGERIVIHAS